MTKTTGAVIIFCTAVAGYFLTAWLAPEADYRGIFVLAGTAAAWIGLTGQHDKVRTETEEIKQKAAQTASVITKIEKQTNGVLDERIESGIRKVLSEMFAEHDKNKVHTVVVTKTPPKKKPRVPRLPSRGQE